ncbi:MAG: M48 family metallopeptidase [Armatimonadetes bacterium]|nr:M48 family metallopeptidase [Armatimonadota bacterium]
MWSIVPRRVTVGGLLIIFIFAMFATGCQNANFFSTKDEVRLGEQGAKQVEQQYRIEVNTPDAIRVRRIGERLLMHIHRRSGMPYSFHVLDSPTINAFSLPGGPVYVFSGLIDLIGNDNDALACVIGHELGHIQARHAVKKLSSEMESGLLISILLRGNAQTLANLGSELINLHYSRGDEYEADWRGVSYAYKAGYDPNGIIRFFEKLQVLEKKQKGAPPAWLQDHPLTKDRIKRIEHIIATHDYKYGM